MMAAHRWGARVTDNDCAADAISASETVTEPTGGPTRHIADLGGVAVASGRRWTAVVEVTVVEDGGGAVLNATVRGVWKDGTSGVCTTDGAGTCSLELGNLRRKSITFTVNSITHTSLTYDPGSNTDPDSDSNGRVITVSRP